MQILLAAAVLPALFLMRYIYRMDRIEKEPIGLLILLAGAGALSCFPAALLETIAGNIIGNVIDPESETYIVIEAFLVVALAEEGCKFIAMRLFTWRNNEFDCNFDGIVYAVFISLGFAALENIMYLQSYGLSIAFQRAILSIPGHMTFDIYMGHHYSKAKKALLYGRSGESRKELMLALLIAVLLHGFYDYCLMSSHEILYYVFFAFVVLLDIVSIKTVKKEAANDAPFEQWPVY
jgi:RsiW-degrading membrane proteinase PrsW (M82 family)